MTNNHLSPLSLPNFSGIEPEHILSVLRDCEAGNGELVLENFEKDFKALVEIDHCIPVSSATSGLHLALIALGVDASDEVICPSFTFAASAFPILYQHATPIFVDSEEETWNISPKYLKIAISSRIRAGKKPKAIVVVHGYGTPANLKEILAISEEFKIPLIEDAANALGSKYQNQQIGTFGHLGVFSFNRNKIISAGSGGCVVSKDPILAEKVRYFAHQAKSRTPYYLHENTGYNYGLSPILAEIVRIQLPSLAGRVLQRRNQYSEYVGKYSEGSHFQIELDEAFCNRWLTVLKLKNLRKESLSDLKAHHVWNPMHCQPVFKKYPYYGNNESLGFFEMGVCLPFRN